MPTHALQIVRNADGGYCWTLLKSSETEPAFAAHAGSGCSFPSYSDALAAGTLALAQADGESTDDHPADEAVPYDA